MIASLALSLGLALAQGQQEPQSSLPAGVQVKLMLLTKLESGGSPVDALVPMAVIEDVKGPDGHVLIHRGAFGFAKVVQSRGEGPLSAPILDRPARLAIQYLHCIAADGQEVRLVASKDKPEDPLHLTREMTSTEAAEHPKLAALWKRPQSRKLLEALVNSLDDGSPGNLADEAERAALETLVDTLNMPATTKMVQEGQLVNLFSTIRRVQNSALRDATGEGGGMPLATAIAAIQEVARLGSSMGGYIKGRFKGRNIRAYPGLVLTAYVAAPTQVKVGGKTRI